jgi:hypothetical protein
MASAQVERCKDSIHDSLWTLTDGRFDARPDLADNLITAAQKMLYPSRMAAPQVFQGHTRFATSSISDMAGVHPHQWTKPSKLPYWVDGLTSKPAHTECFISHNGDLDFFEWHGITYDLSDIQAILCALLHTALPAGVDSMCVAGLLEIHRAKGLWRASVRYGYVYGALSVADNLRELVQSNALWSKATLDQCVGCFETAWEAALDQVKSRAADALSQASGVTKSARGASATPYAPAAPPTPPATLSKSGSAAALASSERRGCRARTAPSAAEASSSSAELDIEMQTETTAAVGMEPAGPGVTHANGEASLIAGAPARDLEDLLAWRISSHDELDDAESAMPHIPASTATETAKLSARKLLARATPLFVAQITSTLLAAEWLSFPPTVDAAGRSDAIHALVTSALNAFLHMDLLAATRQLLAGAKGSFGLVLSHSLDVADQLIVAARGQTMAISFYPQLGLVLFGSEAAATKARITPSYSPDPHVQPRN